LKSFPESVVQNSSRIRKALPEILRD
jgi:hypothetical protein